MTRTKQIGLFLILFATILVSCNESSNIEPTLQEDTNLVTSEDLISLEYLINDMEELVDELIETRGPDDCPEVTFKNPRGEFPNTIIIDFGDHCELHHGHTRSGKVIITQNAPMNEDGATRKTTFENYYVDSVLHEGYKLLTNAGIDENGNIAFARYVEIGLIFPNGQTASWVSSYNKTQFEGAGTDEKFDDAFKVTGSTVGVNRNGNAFSSTIIDDLIRRRNCRWIVSGVVKLEVTTNDGIRTRTIDYAYPTGECDDLAEVTLNDGTTKVIKIHKR